MERAIMCPQCNAPLTPSRFAHTVVCSYCGATVQLAEDLVSAETFHKAFRIWNSPQSYQIPSWVSIGENHWVLDENIAHGEISDVYIGERARWPTELVVVKLLRDRKDASLLDGEWAALQSLHRSNAPGADTFTTLLPQPVMHGNITGGSHVGQRISIFRWTSGFYHTFKEVLQAYPSGINPQASIWVWRRILEVLSFIHASGMAHGSVLPSHLLVQRNEHGVHLVGYGSAGRFGEKLRAVSSDFKSFYPKSSRTLTAQLDLILSARCIVSILGGDPGDGFLPSAVPARLADIVRRIALADPANSLQEDAWSIREELGQIAGEVFGPPRFIPIVMPS